MDWSDIIKKYAKVLLIIVVLALFFIPTFIAAKYVTLWQVYTHFTEKVSDLTGLNKYIAAALGTLFFIPFYLGNKFLFSVRNRQHRIAGAAILVGLSMLYNFGLFYFTRDTYFGFSGGETLKWYAITPEGARIYDRPGIEPKYGIKLRPVTPDMVQRLEHLKKGEFKAINPDSATFFNPITGEAQVWYYQYPDGSFEFYDNPGFHPITGAALKPVTQQLVLDWKKRQEEARRTDEKRNAKLQGQNDQGPATSINGPNSPPPPQPKPKPHDTQAPLPIQIGDLSMAMRQCIWTEKQRGFHTFCEGTMENKSDTKLDVKFTSGLVIDDKGNEYTLSTGPYFLGGPGMLFPFSPQLMPNLPVKFGFAMTSMSRNATAANFILKFATSGTPTDSEVLFRDIPVREQ